MLTILIGIIFGKVIFYNDRIDKKIIDLDTKLKESQNEMIKTKEMLKQYSNQESKVKKQLEPFGEYLDSCEQWFKKQEEKES